MHSSRMRTGRSLTVCCSLLPGGFSLVPGGRGVCLVPGGSPCWGGGLPGPRGVCLVPGGVCLVMGGSPWSEGGLSLSGGFLVSPGGVCLVWGGCLPGPRGVLQRPLPPVNRITYTCKNITLATTSLRPVIKKKNDEPPHPLKFPKE